MYNNNHYQDKFDEFIKNTNNNMFTFEVTKCCGYSTFITVYKNQTIIDLYSNIIHHFGNIEVRELYFISNQNERINIHVSNKKISQFVKDNIICNPIKLNPIYKLPNPVVYRIFFDDGHCNQEHCATVN